MILYHRIPVYAIYSYSVATSLSPEDFMSSPLPFLAPLSVILVIFMISLLLVQYKTASQLSFSHLYHKTTSFWSNPAPSGLQCSTGCFHDMDTPYSSISLILTPTLEGLVKWLCPLTGWTGVFSLTTTSTLAQCFSELAILMGRKRKRLPNSFQHSSRQRNMLKLGCARL